MDDQETDSRLSALEDDLKATRTQVQQILLDLREQVLEFSNPFTAEANLARARNANRTDKSAAEGEAPPAR